MAGDLGKQNFYYASRILEEIWSRRLFSRVGAAEYLQLDRSTVTNIINVLLANGILAVSDEENPLENASDDAVEGAPPRRGRRRSHLAVNPEHGTILGIELQPDAYSVVGLDLSGRTVFTHRAILKNGHGPGTSAAVRSVLQDVVERWNASSPPVLGVGIGVSGIVDPVNGIVRWSLPLQIWEPYPLLDAVSPGFPFPVYVDNDAKCAAWGPLVFAKEQNLANYITVVMEFEESTPDQEQFDRISVGMGIVLDGKILYGPDYTAGEFRSTLFDHQSLGQFRLDYDTMLTAKRDVSVRHDLMLELAQNIGYLVNILNLQAVYLGGGVEQFEHTLRPLLEEQIHQKWLYNYRSKVACRIHFTRMGNSLAAYGAAAMVLKKLFTALPAPDSEHPLLSYVLSSHTD